jgi:hypothetical protein
VPQLQRVVATAAQVQILIHLGLVQHQQVLVLIMQVAAVALVLMPKLQVLVAQAAVALVQMEMEILQHQELLILAVVVAVVELTATAEVVVQV